MKLSSKSLELVKKILEDHNPALIPIVDSNDNHTIETYNKLRDIVGDELISKGFEPDDEPNEYGLELENLIDEIGRLFF